MKDEQVSGKAQKKKAPAFCTGELWRKVSTLLFRPEAEVLCSP